jgi:hypothetical protein
MMSETMPGKSFPANWLIAQDYNPNDHLMNLKGKDYLNVQNRLLWFIRDQRALIAAGLATMSYVVRSELVEQDREAGWAHFKTYVRDVLGNEATMYGSESARDFPDYAEKASTKSLGRALLALGYGAGSAPELDEGERVVDSPVSRPVMRPRPESGLRDAVAASQSAPRPVAPAATTREAAQVAAPGTPASEPSATEQQLSSIRKLCAALGKPEPDAVLTFTQAKQTIVQLSGEYQRARKAS